MAYVNVTEWRAEQVAEWLQGEIIYIFSILFRKTA